ncbi:hypothetical protein QNI19_05110 [Cytophagaceae bacterium DM2B3-1]|uniref:Uncharacterized protein n=2 Tax=Xanthocytophaga TaxID=3078918 RepID=A0AAE3QSU2_9BACT|nr:MULTISPECIES: hypothetical protein [Xanthocytophaga]MDJ1472289.1 hypothetical protein [Xanthocytophaga flavus]MDJ1482048.1 hypothetical protein [Xanthocytophaga flavus]MDJ1492300.1 hypothetical protein [Xanthocytophaga flavus]MDJ1499766.1 hypothetical protein [Xanthocytophaga agilis]
MKKTGKDIPKTSQKKAVAHSEEVNMNGKKGYNETNEDAPVNPDQTQKKKAKELKNQLPSE